MSEIMEAMLESFPNPTTIDGHNVDLVFIDKASCEHYCIGGALMLATCSKIRFPSHSTLQDLLETEFNLEHDLAYTIAWNIVRYNDNEKFEMAWKVVADAIGED